MFEVGFTEIVLIFGIALLVLGPARLPKLAADLGRWAGRARSMARQLRTQLEQETQFDPLADPKPATAATSNTIHAAAPSPTLAAPQDDASRATPTQRAEAVSPPPGEEPAPHEPAPDTLNPTLDAAASAEQTVADEPKHG
jgi:sec-independent protein translocase protein TatB